MNLLRDSFSGINSRFHLVGAYTLVDLVAAMTFAFAADHEEWFGILLLVFILCLGAVFGILGLVYHAAAGLGDGARFSRYAMLLFLPLVWLQLKLVILVYGPTLLGAAGLYRLLAPRKEFSAWVEAPLFWIGPLVDLTVLVLALYSTPLCIHLRLRGLFGAPIRQGLRLFPASPRASLRLGGLILLIVALEGTVHYLQGPDKTDPVPSIPEGLVLFVTNYLSLVTFFGATRVVLARLAPRRDAGTPSDDPQSPPPPG